jgi:hypothetical protein
MIGGLRRRPKNEEVADFGSENPTIPSELNSDLINGLVIRTLYGALESNRGYFVPGIAKMRVENDP